jgi:hypothetical protein
MLFLSAVWDGVSVGGRLTSRSGVHGGSYSVLVSDGAGCLKQATFDVPARLDISITTSRVRCTGNCLLLF